MKSDCHPLDRSPLHLLHRASQAVELVFATWTSGKLTPRQLAVLVAIEDCEGLSQTDLMKRTGIDRSTTTNIVRRLKRKGLLQRRRNSSDTRAYALKLTDEGRRVLHQVMPIAIGLDRRALGALPPERREAFLRTLGVIAAGLQPAPILAFAIGALQRNSARLAASTTNRSRVDTVGRGSRRSGMTWNRVSMRSRVRSTDT